MLTRTLARAFSLVILVLAVSAALPAQSVEVMVTDHTNGNVTVLDHGLTPIGAVALPPPGAGALATIGITLNPAQTLAAVSDFQANRIDFLDLTVSPPVLSGTSVTFTSPALFPEDMVFSPDGACLLISDGRPGFVASIDVTGRTVVSSLTTVQSQAVEFVPNNPNNLVLTADEVGNVVHVLTLGAGCTLTDTGTTVATPGTGPVNITALPDGQVALVTHKDGTVGVLGISGATVSFTGSFNLGVADPMNQVQSVVVVPSLGRAYAYQCHTGNLEVLNIDASDNVTDSGLGIAVGGNTCYLGIELTATDDRSVFVSTSAGVSAINLVSNKVTGLVATGPVPAGVAVKGTFRPRKKVH